jgi:hypothetical protein
MNWLFGRKAAPHSLRPFVPAWLRGAEEEGFARSYEAPLGEAGESYAIALEGPSGRVDAVTNVPSFEFSAAQVAAAGAGSALFSVQQIGDQAASRAASLPITLP